MAVIEAKHYEETRVRMTKDPIVIAMAHGLADVPREQLVHEDGTTPRHEFMLKANAEYRERGGEDGGHLGAIPEALLRVLDSGVVKPTKVVTYYASRDSMSAWRDEDRAMAHASIVGNEPSFKKAQDELAAYMVKEAAYLLRDAHSDSLHERAKKILALVADVFTAEFPGEESHESLSFEVDQLQFQLVRVASNPK